ncbi:MAG: TolC family protein [Steroidobacteraceae bacterium]
MFACLLPSARAGALALLCVTVLSPSAFADNPLTLQQAVGRALERNPDLAAFQYELEAQQGVLQLTRARPSPEVGLLVENAFGSGRRSDFDAAETTLSLGFAIERGARQRRIDVAIAGSEQLATEKRIQRLDVAAEAARRFVVVLERQQALDDARSATKLFEETIKAVQARVRAAKVPEAEEGRALAQLARVRLDEEHAEHGLATGRLRLAALWGDAQVNFGEAQGDLLSPPALEQFEAVHARITSNTDFERLVSEKRVREAELRLAQMRAKPPWHVTAGIRRFEDEDDHALVVGITVPLPSRDYAQGAIAQARAQSAQVDAQTQALRARLEAELFALYQELNHSYTEVDTLRKEVLPRIEAALEQSRYAYERGRYGYIEWVTAQRELLDVRRALLEASAQLHQFRIEIERLTGTALGVEPRK